MQNRKQLFFFLPGRHVHQPVLQSRVIRQVIDYGFGTARNWSDVLVSRVSAA